MKVDFRKKQHEFSSYIKDPFNNPPPADIKQQRIETYRDLFFNNINSFLSNNFPVIKTILTEQQWFELAQDFFSNHSSTTPHFSEIPEEFIDFLQNERKNNEDYPFLLELAHYEWVEMALSISTENVESNSIEFITHLTPQAISISPLAWPLAYQFPVQKISSSFLPDTAPEEPSYLLVYRDVSDEVHFMQLPAITFRLLQIIQEDERRPCEDYLKQIAQESTHPEPDKLFASGLSAITSLAEKNIIIPHHSS
jgi:hypothetical protein